MEKCPGYEEAVRPRCTVSRMVRYNVHTETLEWTVANLSRKNIVPEEIKKYINKDIEWKRENIE